MLSEGEVTRAYMRSYGKKSLSPRSDAMNKNELVSSLLKKRRRNRLLKQPVLVLDAVCNCAVTRLQEEMALENLKRVADTSCDPASLKISRAKRNYPLPSAETSNIKLEEEQEIERLLGVDRFFEKLKVKPISKRKKWDLPDLNLNDDPSLNDLVLSFIETGTYMDYKSNEVDSRDHEVFSWSKRVPIQCTLSSLLCCS